MAPGRDEVVQAVTVVRARAGHPVDPRPLPVRAQRALALAHGSGAPVGPAIAAAVVAADDERARGRAVRRAAAEARSVARVLVLVPPVLGPLTAALLTDEPFAVWSTPVGSAVLALAAVLWVTGWVLVRVLVAAALRAPGSRGPSDEQLDLVATGVAAGLGLAAAVRAAAEVVEVEDRATLRAVALWFELGRTGDVPVGWGELGPALRDAAADGLPLVSLLHELAARQRAAEQQVALERAARLGARLTVPTTLLLLPAAVLVAGTPLVAAALRSLG